MLTSFQLDNASSFSLRNLSNIKHRSRDSLKNSGNNGSFILILVCRFILVGSSKNCVSNCSFFIIKLKFTLLIEDSQSVFICWSILFRGSLKMGQMDTMCDNVSTGAFDSPCHHQDVNTTDRQTNKRTTLTLSQM